MTEDDLKQQTVAADYGGVLRLRLHARYSRFQFGIGESFTMHGKTWRCTRIDKFPDGSLDVHAQHLESDT